MKKGMLGFVIGCVLGILLVMSVVGVWIAGSWVNRTPIVFVPYQCSNSGNDVVFHIPRFTIIFKDNKQQVAAVGSITIAGHEGTIPSFGWGGAGEGWGATDHKMDVAHLYDSSIGRAVVYCCGNIFFIWDEATRLQINDTNIALKPGHTLIVVEKTGIARVAGAEESQTLLASVDPWILSDSGADLGSVMGPQGRPTTATTNKALDASP